MPFERYADDVIAHCRTEKEAQEMRKAIAARLQSCGLELHPEKTEEDLPKRKVRFSGLHVSAQELNKSHGEVLHTTAIVRRNVCEVLHIEVGTDENIFKNGGLLLCASVLLFLPGCNRIARAWYLSSYDRDISNSTKATGAARDNAQRAEAYAKRGSAYSEKARYSKAFKLISADEYDRFFGLAIKDHD
jgi:hypothetical protein